MLPKTRNRRQLRNLFLTHTVLPESKGWILLVVLGEQKSTLVCDSSGNISNFLWAKQFSFNNNTFFPELLPMYRFILLRQLIKQVGGIQSFFIPVIVKTELLTLISIKCSRLFCATDSHERQLFRTCIHCNEPKTWFSSYLPRTLWRSF